MKKPDRFERAVDKFDWRDEWCTPVIDARKAIDLLRKEHVWMRRMVSGLDDVSYTHMSDDYQAGMHHAYHAVLWKLAKRRK